MSEFIVGQAVVLRYSRRLARITDVRKDHFLVEIKSDLNETWNVPITMYGREVLPIGEPSSSIHSHIDTNLSFKYMVGQEAHFLNGYVVDNLGMWLRVLVPSIGARYFYESEIVEETAGSFWESYL